LPEICLHDIAASHGDVQVLDGVSLRVHDKEFVTLLGPSGCGKTTTLMVMAGFHHPERGRITCGDDVFFDAGEHRTLAPERRNLGIVFQSYALWPHMTVAGNVGFPLQLRRINKQGRKRRVHEVLELVELGEHADRYPHQLSGGQQQRVALARALSFSPSVLLLDEPFSNLDAKLRERAREWLKALQREIGITTVFVTHDQHEALSMSDRVMVMNNGEILQSGAPEDIYARPNSRFVADFVGQCNFLGATVVSAGTGTVTVSIDGVPQPVPVVTDRQTTKGARVTLALRPERILFVEPPAGTQAVVTDATVAEESFLGDRYHYRLVIGGAEVLAQASSRIVDRTVPVWIDPGYLTVVDELPITAD
jgi:iron(III) transport system ATP-binding protein